MVHGIMFMIQCCTYLYTPSCTGIVWRWKVRLRWKCIRTEIKWLQQQKELTPTKQEDDWDNGFINHNIKGSGATFMFKIAVESTLQMSCSKVNAAFQVLLPIYAASAARFVSSHDWSVFSTDKNKQREVYRTKRSSSLRTSKSIQIYPFTLLTRFNTRLYVSKAFCCWNKFVLCAAYMYWHTRNRMRTEFSQNVGCIYAKQWCQS